MTDRTTTMTAREQILMAMAGRSKNERISLARWATTLVETLDTSMTGITTTAPKYTTTRKPRKPRKPRKRTTTTTTTKTSGGGAIFDEDGETMAAGV